MTPNLSYDYSKRERENKMEYRRTKIIKYSDEKKWNLRPSMMLALVFDIRARLRFSRLHVTAGCDFPQLFKKYVVFLLLLVFFHSRIRGACFVIADYNTTLSVIMLFICNVHANKNNNTPSLYVICMECCAT